MGGHRGRRQPLRLDDQLGHLIPPGQLLPEDVSNAVLQTLESHSSSAGRVSDRYEVRMHPADRAWMPADGIRRVSQLATARADQLGMNLLDGIKVRFVSDASMQMGSLAVSGLSSAPAVIELRDETLTL